MTDYEMWLLLVGFFLPLAISVIQQQGWSDQLRAIVAFAACAIAGAGTAYFQGDFTGKRIISGILIVAVTALTTYRNFWKPTEISPTIETKTSFGDGGK